MSTGVSERWGEKWGKASTRSRGNSVYLDEVCGQAGASVGEME